MKLVGKFSLLLILLVAVGLILGLGYLGFIPGLSSLFGSDKPRDLGVIYTEADRLSGRAKSQMEYVSLANADTTPGGFQTLGSRPVTAELTSAEITAIMNNKPWKYYPYKNVQLKFNADGSAEISGVLIKERVAEYGASFGAPKEAIVFVNKFLPSEPVFYLKGRAALTENKVSLFEPQVFEIGRFPMPLQAFLSLGNSLVKETYAVDIWGMTEELSKVQNKRALIIDFITDLKKTPTYVGDELSSDTSSLFRRGNPDAKSGRMSLTAV